MWGATAGGAFWLAVWIAEGPVQNWTTDDDL